MKRFFLFMLSLLIITGCQKNNKQPMKTPFSTNINPPPLQTAGYFTIQPPSPTTESILTVALPNNINLKSIVWYIDNQESVVSNSLSKDFKKGDNITAVVNYLNRENKQVSTTTPQITIQDAPPVITSLTLEPLYPTVASTIHASVQTYDADGDPVSLTYQWYVNNKPVSDQTGDSFSCEAYKHGDLIYAVVTPFDGEKNGNSVTSSYISIQDTPPVIVSTPPTSITGSTFLYKVEAVDLDKDPLTYKLESAPEGMKIDNNGIISWNIKDVALPVTVTVKVVVDDGYGGKAYQTFTLKLEKQNG